MGQLGLPPDGVAWASISLSLVLLLLTARRSWRMRFESICSKYYHRLLIALCLSAALLSWGYFAYYLRGGPRIIDATAYLLEARGFATGHWTLPVDTVSAAERGRFLYFDPAHHRLSVLFPPGYPAVLSVAIRLGSPYLLGPLLAALLVWFTAKLTERLFACRSAALLAACLSVTNACLRYHTADTMSHGLCALLILATFYAAFGQNRGNAAASGIALGWLLATRPITGIAIGIVIACYFALNRRVWGEVASWLLGLLPGALLWISYQYLSTGSPFMSTQLAYYAVADGPPGCFRYGFGHGIGCLFEHGSYVEKRLPHGYGLGQASYVTLLRLRWHALDTLNFELLCPLVVLALGQAARNGRQRYLFFAVIAVVLGYLPFYFDGSYPGGGARFYADIIPLEHVLLAGLYLSLNWLFDATGQRAFSRSTAPPAPASPANPQASRPKWHCALARWVLPLSLGGFALHGSFEHRQLQKRDGGRPLFEPSVLTEQNVTRGLVFVDSDHGFNLGLEPAITDPQKGVVVRRYHGDAHDRLTWRNLGQPPSFRYEFDPLALGRNPRVTPVSVEHFNQAQWFEAEAEWPPLRVQLGWARQVYPPNACTSQLRGLSLEPAQGRARIAVELHVERDGEYRLIMGWVARRAGRQRVTVSVEDRNFYVDRDASNHQCFETVHESVRLSTGAHELTIEANLLGIVLDRYRVESITIAG